MAMAMAMARMEESMGLAGRHDDVKGSVHSS